MSDEPVATTASPHRGTFVAAVPIDADGALVARQRTRPS